MAELARLGGGRFLVLGRAGMDLYADPPQTRIAQARSFAAHLGGSAANIAVALARQGMRAGLLGCLSDDPVGDFCRAELARYGVDQRHVGRSRPGTRTSLAVVETRPVDCASVIYRNGAADFDLSPADVRAVDFSGVDALVITGTALAEEGSRRAVHEALSSAQNAGTVCVLDVDFRPYSWVTREEARHESLRAAHRCDIVVGNDEEFALLAGSPEAGQGLAQALAARGAVAIYKMGARGALTFAEGRRIETGIYRTPALKPTGAGDAFLGGVLAGLAQGRPIREAVLRGSAAAAIVVSRIGCAPACPSAEEMEAFLAAQPEPEPEAEGAEDAHSAA